MAATSVRPAGPRRRHTGWALVALGAAGTAVMAANGHIRALEAQAAGRMAGVVARGPTYVWAAHHSFYWNLGRHGATGLTVTAECTSAFTVGPLLIVAGLLFTWRRPPVLRMLTAIATTVAVALAGNLARLATVTWATYHYGNNGFTWSHTYAGTVITIATVMAALIALARLALPKTPPARPGAPG